MKKSGKAFLLTSGILETIYGILVILGSLILLVSSFATGSVAELVTFGLAKFTITLIVIVALIAIGLGTMLLVFGSISINTTTKDADKFLAARGKILAFAIIETIFLLLMIIGSIPTDQQNSSTTTIGSIIVCVLLAIVVAFKFTAYGLMVSSTKQIKENK